MNKSYLLLIFSSFFTISIHPTTPKPSIPNKRERIKAAVIAASNIKKDKKKKDKDAPKTQFPFPVRKIKPSIIHL